MNQVCEYFIIVVILFETSGGIIKKPNYYPWLTTTIHKAFPTRKLSGFVCEDKGRFTTANILSVFQVLEVYQLGKHIPFLK